MVFISFTYCFSRFVSESSQIHPFHEQISAKSLCSALPYFGGILARADPEKNNFFNHSSNRALLSQRSKRWSFHCVCGVPPTSAHRHHPIESVSRRSHTHSHISSLPLPNPPSLSRHQHTSHGFQIGLLIASLIVAMIVLLFGLCSIVFQACCFNGLIDCFACACSRCPQAVLGEARICHHLTFMFLSSCTHVFMSVKRDFGSSDSSVIDAVAYSIMYRHY